MTKHETDQERLYKKIQFAGAVIALVVTLGSVVAGYFNFGVVTKLAPLTQDIALMHQEIIAVEKINDTQISRDEFGQVIKRLDAISNRLDQLIARR